MSARRMASGAGLILASLLAAVPASANENVPGADAGNCTTSLIGTPLTIPEYPAATQKKLDEDIEIARFALRIAPDREESHFWLGRRLGYAGRVCEAIAVFSEGLKAFPESYKLRRYRARHLARARAFDAALADYRDALALIMPSIGYEVFGIVLIEAFAQRTPVIVRDLGGMPEAVEDSGGGLVYRNDDDLHAAMAKVQTSSDLRRNLGECGHAGYLKIWSEQPHIDRYLTIIEDEAGRHRASPRARHAAHA